MLAEGLSTWLIDGMLEMPEVSGSHVKADCQTCSVVLVLQVSESLRAVILTSRQS